ncbi:MAG: tetratricopeptide repeat protein, partial [Ktedonobacteraceae bacterium]
MQPIFPYFLLNRLNAPEQREARSAVETAFREHYDQIGEMLFELLQSKEPQKRQAGQILTGLEYKNLITALNLALTAQVSILNLYNAISTYLDITQDQSEGLELGQVVLSRLESYSTIKFIGQVIDEFIGIIDNIAMRQFLLKQYVTAEESYKKAIAILLANKDSDSETIIKKGATIYHQLGMVAQGQRHWEQAEQYYQQALEIYIVYKDFYAQADAYHNLGIIAREQRKWNKAEQYYQKALEIYIMYNDLSRQAGTYLQLGMLAEEQ